MSAEVLDLRRGVQVLRGPAAVADYDKRLKLRRRDAYERALYNGLNKADVAMFKSAENLIAIGPWDHAGRPAAQPSVG